MGNAANNLNWKTANLNIWGASGGPQPVDFNNENQSSNSGEASPWTIDSNGLNRKILGNSGDNFQTASSKSSLTSSCNDAKPETSAFQMSSSASSQQSAASVTGKAKGKQTKKDEALPAAAAASAAPPKSKAQKALPTDEFSKWCISALAQFQASIDVPEFISFLKGVESPHDVNDYVFSYLGENKDSKEFAKRFIEKRSYYKNQAKKASSSEEMILGPAPAIIPASVQTKVQNKVEESEFSIFSKSKKKKKSGKKNETSD